MTDSAYKFRFEPEGNQGQRGAKGQTKRKRHRSDPLTVCFFSLGGPLLLRSAPFISLIECSLCFAFIIFIVAFTTAQQEKKKNRRQPNSSLKLKGQPMGQKLWRTSARPVVAAIWSFEPDPNVPEGGDSCSVTIASPL